MGQHSFPPAPMSIPRIGNQQIPFDISQADKRLCPCGCEYFHRYFRLGVVSKMASRNTTGIDVLIEYPAYVCRDCGVELKGGGGPQS